MRKKIALSALLAALLLTWSGCEELRTIAEGVGTSTGSSDPTNSEIIAGLKQALEIGTKNSVDILNKKDGFFGDPLVRIPFPPDAIKVANTLRDIGAGSLVDEFVKLMNRGAEQAAGEAVPIFVNAIKAMTFQDAKNILLGPDNAATDYFRRTTSKPLYNAFSPKVRSALQLVKADVAWTEVTKRYNQIPFVQPVNTDLTDYTTNKALDGLFLKIENEEKLIRKNPVKRITELLKKVFGVLDRR